MRRKQQRSARGVDLSGPAIDARKAIDLNAYKGGNTVKQRRAVTNLLKQNAYICSCGERFEDEGIIAMGTWAGIMPDAEMTPQGPKVVLKDGAIIVTRAFHSKACVDYLDALANGIEREEGEERVTIMAVRRMPDTEWLADTPEVPEEEQPDTLSPDQDHDLAAAEAAEAE